MGQATTNYGFLNELLRELGTQKQATVKAADQPLSEPGGYVGATSHPSKDVDDHTRKATEGARSAENERDVKDNREGPSVNATSEASASTGEGAGKQDEVQLNIGTEQSSVGDDPSVEDDYKGRKDDPGTSSPMNTEIGPKYGEYRKMAAAPLAAHVVDCGNDLLATIGLDRQKQAVTLGANLPVAGTRPLAAPGVPAPATAPAAPAAPTGAVPAMPQPPHKLAAAAQAGYDMAAALGAPADKQAQARQLIAATVKEAAHMADLTAGHLADRWEWARKQAAGVDDGEEGEDHARPGDATSGAGDAGAMGGPMGGPGGPGGPGGGGGSDMLAMMGGGGGGGAPPGGPPGGPPGMPGMPPPPGGGGAPPMDPAMGGGDPAAAGGGVSDDQALQELASALMEMGIDPHQLAALMEQGGPPGGPQVPAQKAAGIKKAALDVARLRKSGRFAFAPPASEKLAQLRADFRKLVAEVCGTR